MSVNAIIEMSVAIFITSEKKNNITAALLLALNVVLFALGLWRLVSEWESQSAGRVVFGTRDPH